MKTLYLLRHANAHSSTGYEDIDRPLSEKGISDAQNLGLIIRKEKDLIEQVYCSSAKRTGMTLEALDLKCPVVKISQKLYLGTAQNYLDILQDTHDEHSSVLLVGHNPSIHELVRFLSAHHTEDIQPLSYAPCTLSIFKINSTGWINLSPALCTLEQIITPPFSPL